MDVQASLVSEAENWDRGSQEDEVRNRFVIPELVLQLNEFTPKSILDIGAATGYVAREINKRLDFEPVWTLLDRSESRLSYASSLVPGNMKASIVHGDFFEFPSDGDQYDAIIMCFTLLELLWTEALFARLKAISKKDGRLLVVLPDAWCDVLRSGEDAKSNAIKFLSDAVKIEKVDKFTRELYPFIAQRLEVLLSGLVRHGFSLVHFKDSKLNQSKLFILTFKNG